MSEQKDEHKKALTNHGESAPPVSSDTAEASSEAEAVKQKAAVQDDSGKAAVSDAAAKEAKRKAAAEARAARAAERAAKEAEEGQAAADPKPPSPLQPQLDAITALLRTEIGADAFAESYVNELNAMPTIIVNSVHWLPAAKLLKAHKQTRFQYLRNISGVDYETYMEVVYHMVNLDNRQGLAVKVRIERESPSIDSVTAIWATANWNEREIYDLLGIYFPGHPDLRRIMMPDDWEGHPLRKDYVSLDSEV